MRDDGRGDHEQGDDRGDESGIEGEPPPPSERHGDFREEIALGIELEEVGPLLHETDPDAEEVAPEEAAERDEERAPEEDPAELSVGHAEGFQKTDHAGPFEDEDQQGGGHVEEGHDEHDDDDDHGVDVVRLQPVEDVGVTLRDAHDGEVCGFVAVVVEEGPVEAPGELRGPVERTGADLVTGDLVGPPVGEALHVPNIGEDDGAVHLLHAGVVDARDLEAVAAGQFTGIDEEHLDPVADAEFHAFGGDTGDEQILRADGIPDAGQLTLREPLAEAGPVVVGADAFEEHFSDGVIRADDAALDGIGRHGDEAVGRADDRFQTRAAPHGLRVEGIDAADVRHGDMCGHTLHLAGDLALEAEDDGHGEDHHGDTERHRPDGNALHDPGFVLRSGPGHAAGDDKGKIHDRSELS